MSSVRRYRKFVEEADHWAAKSKDPSTQVGVVIVPAGTDLPLPGYNGFPRGVNDDEDGALGRWERPRKYSYVEHAERNAIYNAAALGISTRGATMFFNWEPTPCADCARAIIQAGIIRIVGYPSRKFPGKGQQWEESCAIGQEMLREAGVQIIHLADSGQPIEEEKKSGCGGCGGACGGNPLPQVEGFFDRAAVRAKPPGHR